MTQRVRDLLPIKNARRRTPRSVRVLDYEISKPRTPPAAPPATKPITTAIRAQYDPVVRRAQIGRLKSEINLIRSWCQVDQRLVASQSSAAHGSSTICGVLDICARNHRDATTMATEFGPIAAVDTRGATTASDPLGIRHDHRLRSPPDV